MIGLDPQEDDGNLNQWKSQTRDRLVGHPLALGVEQPIKKFRVLTFY